MVGLPTKFALAAIVLAAGACRTTSGESSAQGVTTRSGLSTDSPPDSSSVGGSQGTVFDAKKEKPIETDQATLAKAASIIKGLTYLPDWHVDDGCDSRAFYQGAELAVRGIVSNQIYIFPNPGTSLRPKRLVESRLPLPDEDNKPGSISWVYHTAPFLFVEGTEMVIDPLQSSSPMTVDDWLANMGTTRSQVSIVIRPWSIASGLMNPGGVSQRTVAPAADFQSMPKFKASQMTEICIALAQDAIKDQGWTPEQTKIADTTSQQIIDRTGPLYKSLLDLGLAGTDDDPMKTCQKSLDNGVDEG